MEDEEPADRIEAHATKLRELDDEGFLAAIAGIEPLPDADDLDPAWDDDAFLRAELLIAVADEIGRRGAVGGIVPLYERAPRGDAFEMMQSLRHGPEQAVGEDTPRLVHIMRGLARNSRPGTRRWAIEELGELADGAAFPEVLAALNDEVPEVRAAACIAAGHLDGLDAPSISRLEERLTALVGDPVPNVSDWATECLGWLKERSA